MRHSCVLVGALALSSCTTLASSSGTTGTPVAGFGQTAWVDHLRVRPKRLLEDSRCPATVHCVWQGRVVVQVEVDRGAGSDVADLTLGVPADMGEMWLTLVSVEPEKAAAGTLSPQVYRFTFSARREPSAGTFSVDAS